MDPRRTRRAGLLTCASALLAALACQAPEADEPLPRQDAAERPGRVVDSIFPIEEEIRRFRAVLGPEPAGLSGGASSREALIDRFVTALVEADTAAFADMVMNIDEFGWLYYPHTIFTAPPYELAPGLVWFQIQNGSSRGLGRLLGRVAGRPLEVLGHRCAPEPLIEGPNRIWEECVLLVDPAEGEPQEVAYFGSMLERDGAFKFTSYSNDF